MCRRNKLWRSDSGSLGPVPAKLVLTLTLHLAQILSLLAVTLAGSLTGSHQKVGLLSATSNLCKLDTGSKSCLWGTGWREDTP